MTIFKILGLVLYITVVLYAISGIANIWEKAERGGSLTKAGLFLWALAIVCVLIFGLTEISKLHILWIIPTGFILSSTSLGQIIGQIVGQITGFIFGSKYD